MARNVKVHLVQRQGFRASKGEDFTWYEVGMNEMPYEHARAMGLLNRIASSVETLPDGTVVQATNDPFQGAFDEALTKTLTGAGYKTLADLENAQQDELMAVKGIGPAAYERIHNAIAMSKGD